MENLSKHLGESCFDIHPLKKQNQLIEDRLKSFDAIMLLVTKHPNYPFVNLTSDTIQTIEAHASNARKRH